MGLPSASFPLPNFQKTDRQTDRHPLKPKWLWGGYGENMSALLMGLEREGGAPGPFSRTQGEGALKH